MKDDVSQEESEPAEVDGIKNEDDRKKRLVICNKEDTSGRTRVTADKERVLHVGYRFLFRQALFRQAVFRQALFRHAVFRQFLPICRYP